MARRRDFVRGAAAIGQKRMTLWLGFEPLVASGATGGTILGSLNAAALALRPFTIIRTRLEVAVRSDQAAAIEHQIMGLGVAIVSDEALAVGVTAVPTPITSSSSDLWLSHQIILGDESALTDRTRASRFITVDSKAMRKVEPGQDLAIVSELSSAAQGAIMTVGGRILIKLF